jgi:hypothetical protein
MCIRKTLSKYFPNPKEIKNGTIEFVVTLRVASIQVNVNNNNTTQKK